MKKIVKLVATSSISLLLGVSGVFAHDAPTEHKGVSVFGKAVLELGTQIPAMKGYQLQVRSVVVEPNGVVKFHKHDMRPGAFYVVKGDGVREFQSAEDKVGRIVKAGEVVVENSETEHWVKNEGGEAQFFVLDIVPTK